MIQTFDRNTADLIMGMSAPIVIQIAQWKDLLSYLKSKEVIKGDIVVGYSNQTSSGNLGTDFYDMVQYKVINDFAVVFEEETKLSGIRIHEFKHETNFPHNYIDSVKAELKYLGYSDAAILPAVTADNIFDD